MRKYNMVLKHVPNIDIAYRGGYWQSYEDNEDVVIEENKLSIMRDKFVDWKVEHVKGMGHRVPLDVFTNMYNKIV